MGLDQTLDNQDAAAVRQMLTESGYAEKAVDYYLKKAYMGSIDNATQVSELTGHCGDTMKIFLDIEDNIIKDARIQVLGCPGAIASAMVLMEIVRGKDLETALGYKDADVFAILENLPDQKQHCIRLSVKTLHKAINEYKAGE